MKTQFLKYLSYTINHLTHDIRARIWCPDIFVTSSSVDLEKFKLLMEAK